MKTVQLNHSEIVQATQQAMISQLHKDKHLVPGAELGLTFYSASPEDMRVIGNLRKNGRVLLQLRGGRQELCEIASQVALDKLPLTEKRGLQPKTKVRWRLVEFSTDDEIVDAFIVEVQFQEKEAVA